MNLVVHPLADTNLSSTSWLNCYELQLKSPEMSNRTVYLSTVNSKDTSAKKLFT